MGSEIEFGQSNRALFQLEDGAIYLNHGSYGATPFGVRDAQRHWQERLEAEPSRFMEREFRPALRTAADHLGDFIGAKGPDLVLVENATDAVNAVLNSLSFSDGDEILTTNQTYNAVKNSVRWTETRNGAQMKSVDLPFPINSEEEIVDAFRSGLNRNTKLVIIDHITSPTALVLPIERMIEEARKAKALILIDGAHAPGMLPLDIEALGVDFYTGNCHKWLFAAKGCAFLWVHPDHQSMIHPTVISHGYGSGYVNEFDWVGTRDASAQHSLPTAIEFYQELGDEAIRDHNNTLVREAASELAEKWSTRTGAPDAMLGSMAMVRLPDGFGHSQEEASKFRAHLLDTYRIQVPVNALNGGLWVRLSAQIYNDLEEYRTLGSAILTEAAKR